MLVKYKQIVLPMAANASSLRLQPSFRNLKQAKMMIQPKKDDSRFLSEQADWSRRTSSTWTLWMSSINSRQLATYSSRRQRLQLKLQVCFIKRKRPSH